MSERASESERWRVRERENGGCESGCEGEREGKRKREEAEAGGGGERSVPDRGEIGGGMEERC